MMRAISRREFATVSAALLHSGSAFGQTSWKAGQVTHLLPTVSHDRIRIKASLVDPLARPPLLFLDGKPVPGQRVDSAGHFWTFDAADLSPARTYSLELKEAVCMRASAAVPRVR